MRIELAELSDNSSEVVFLQSLCYNKETWGKEGNMIKKVAIAGLQLDNYTVRESIMEIERNLSNGVFNTVEDVSMDMIVAAEEDPKIKDLLENLDHTLISEVGVLKAVSEVSIQRKHEIENNDFYTEFMKRVARNHKQVYVLGQDRETVDEVCQRIQKEFPKCEIIGTGALDGTAGASEAVVNDINTVAPDVVLSVIPSPAQEYFLMENKDKLGANLWYGMGKVEKKRKGILGALQRTAKCHRFARFVHQMDRKATTNEP